MEIPVLISCPTLGNQVGKYLKFVSEYYFGDYIPKIYDTFTAVKNGVVFVGFEDGLFPRLSSDYDKKILYIYLREEIPTTKNTKGCEIIVSENKPKNYIFFNNFAKAINIIEIIESLKKVVKDYEVLAKENVTKYDACGQIDQWVGEKYDMLSPYELMIENSTNYETEDDIVYDTPLPGE
jgi:hypothetical protein